MSPSVERTNAIRPNPLMPQDSKTSLQALEWLSISTLESQNGVRFACVFMIDRYLTTPLRDFLNFGFFSSSSLYYLMYNVDHVSKISTSICNKLMQKVNLKSHKKFTELL